MALRPFLHLGISMAQPFTGDTPMEHLQTLLRSLPEWQHEQAKAEFLDFLYDLYDRDNAPLGLRGTYTGLWERYQREIAELARLSIYLAQ
jgi:hypothetical protein